MTELRGAHASLEPITSSHADELWRAAKDVSLWAYMPNPPPAGVVHLRQWIDWRLAASGRHDATYLVRDAEGVACGSTSLFAHDPAQRRAEIGWTWYGAAWHGTLLNKQVKRLLLAHAFDELGLNRVQMKCDARNQRSFHAMAAIGAVHEGTLRQHDVLWDGHVRDVEMFSITRSEWPAVRDHLDRRLAAPA